MNDATVIRQDGEFWVAWQFGAPVARSRQKHVIIRTFPDAIVEEDQDG